MQKMVTTWTLLGAPLTHIYIRQQIAVIPAKGPETFVAVLITISWGKALRNRRPLCINTMSTVAAISTVAAVDEEGEEVEEPVSPAGRVFHRPEFNCYIIAVIGLERCVDNLDSIKTGLAATLIRHPRFSSIPVFDESKGKKPRWVRVKVDVDSHVIVPDLSPLPSSSGAGAGSERVVEDYVSELSATADAMDGTRPLWELHILNLPTSSAAASAVLRAHHSLGDGASLTSLLLACTRQAGDPSSLPSIPSAAPRPRPHHGRGRDLLGLLRWLLSLLAMAWHTLVDAALFVATSAFLADTPTPLKAPNSAPGDPLGVGRRRKRFVHRTINLDDVKRVKNAMGCTVNDVLVGITSAGLSRYLSRKYGETDDRLLAKLRVRSTLLVNVRPTAGIHDLAEMMKGGKDGPKWGNWIGYVTLPIPIVLYSDPLDYIRKGIEIADRKKNSWEAFFTSWIGILIVKFFGQKAAATLCHRVLSNTTLSFSNIVGPVEKIEFYGYPILYIAPSVFGHPQALTVHYQSYMNTMEIVLAVDEVTIPDPYQLLDDLEESLDKIKNSTAEKS